MVTVLEKAIAIAVMAHLGQTDKCGRPYILHCIRVMLKGKTDDEKAVGILHDVIEDTEITVEELLEEEMPLHIVEAVEAISHRHQKSEPLVEYFARIRENSLARTVKEYDLEDNNDPERLGALDEKTRTRLERKHIRSKDLLNL